MVFLFWSCSVKNLGQVLSHSKISLEREMRDLLALRTKVTEAEARIGRSGSGDCQQGHPLLAQARTTHRQRGGRSVNHEARPAPERLELGRCTVEVIGPCRAPSFAPSARETRLPPTSISPSDSQLPYAVRTSRSPRSKQAWRQCAYVAVA